MPRYVALLRAINVGGHVVKMELLRREFAALGFSNVETFIASGNVVFESRSQNAQALEQRIETRLGAALGYPVSTFLRTPAELARIVQYEPFAPADMNAPGSTLYIGFLSVPPEPAAQEKIVACRTAVDDFHVHKRELYWLCRTKLGESLVSGAVLAKALGMPTTMRNATTIRRLTEKYAQPR
ncbi:MAG: DUF1697 domain-containing protein [Acidobacteria bacterium]|nr:DUF1697 domain-containing protein [Acidobacteriota bacterium]MCA1650364.1 DUF1697 domain-containing protein [Acidobacteriota bacterium]